jgi:hypothetical protein
MVTPPRINSVLRNIAAIANIEDIKKILQQITNHIGLTGQVEGGTPRLNESLSYIDSVPGIFNEINALISALQTSVDSLDTSLTDLLSDLSWFLTLISSMANNKTVYTSGGQFLLTDLTTLARTFISLSDNMAMCKLLNTWFVLPHISVAVNTPSVTTEEKLGTILVPAGRLGLNGIIRIHVVFSHTNNANNKTTRVRLHTSDTVGGTVIHSNTATTNAFTDFRLQIAAQNSNTSQRSKQGVVTGGSGAAALIATSLNFKNDVYIIFTGQKAVAGDTLGLEHAFAEMLQTD